MNCPDLLNDSDRSLRLPSPIGLCGDHRRPGRPAAGGLARVLVAAALLAACGDGTPSPGAVAQRDSAGVRIVDNQSPAWSAEEALALSPEPTLVIGTGGGTEYDLSRVVGAARLADGRIVIGDGGSLELRFYDPAGKYLRSVGGRGSGPGELTGMFKLDRLAGDTLAVLASPTSASLFDGDGTFVHSLDTRAMGLGLPGIPAILGVMPGRTILIGSAGMMAPRAEGDEWMDSIPVAVLGPDSTVRQLPARFPAFDVVMGAQGPRLRLFAGHGVYAVSDRSFFWGTGGEYAIGMYSLDGRLERSIRRRWTPVPVTDADLDRYAESSSEGQGPEAEKEKREARDQPHAESVPAFSQLIVDREGRLWVRAANLADAAISGQVVDTYPREASSWSVFDADGTWLCDVSMPARFLPKDIGPDYVLGVARDDLDVQTVVQYALRAGAAER